MDKSLDKVIKQYLDDNREQFIKELRGILSFNSVKADPVEGKPFGLETAKALNYMESLCTDAGLTTRNFDYYCMDAEYGSGEEVVATLTHLDIVPAGDNWTHPPFAGEMEGSVMYGRGIIDNKGPGLAALYALKALMHADAKMNRKIRLIYGCDEETGMTDMKHYLSKVKPPEFAFSPDADFPVIFAEKHGIGGKYVATIEGDTSLMSLQGGTVANAVPGIATAKVKSDVCPKSTEKVEYSLADGVLNITANGVAAHASTPHLGENAVIILINAIVGLLPEDDAAMPLLNSIIKYMSAHDGSGLGINCNDEPSGALTMNLGIISLEDNVISITFDIRHPVTLECQDTMDKLVDALPMFVLDKIGMHYGVHRPKDGFLVKTLISVYNEITGENAEPIAIGGGTYARTLPNAVAFGPEFPDGNFGGAHTVDEYGDIDELLEGARIYAHSLYELANC